MKNTTYEMIGTIISGDASVTPEQKAAILKTCQQPVSVPRRKLITARAAMDILQISRPTLREYVKSGTLSQINFSQRKVRFVEQEVNDLAYNGISQSGAMAPL